MPVPGDTIGRILLPRSSHKERNFYGGPSPSLVLLPIMVPWLSGGARLLPSIPSVATAWTLQAVSIPNLVLSLQLSFGIWASAPTPHPVYKGVSQAGERRPTHCVGYLLHFAFHKQVAAFPLLGSKTAPSSLISPLVRGLLRCGNISSFTVPSPDRPHPDSCCFLSVLLSYVGVFLSFQRSEVFCRQPVAVLCESFHL